MEGARNKMDRKTTLKAAYLLTLLLGASIGFQLTLLARANFFPDPGPDLPRIYIRSDGTVEPSSAPILRTGSRYQLTGNITLFTVEIQRDNIVIDGSDYFIMGNESWVGTAPRSADAGNNGIIIAARNNVTITRLYIEKCTTGIRISTSSNININGNVFINETAAMDDTMGIAIQNSSLVLIENNNFTGIHGSAIICNGTNNIIRGNTLTDGIASIDGSIALEGSSNTISDNKIEDLLPITMDKANSNTIARNNITGPAYQNYEGNEGIALYVNCSNNVIYGNNITGFVNQAIRTVFSCSNNTIYDNYFANNGFAVALQDGAVNNTFYGNTFTATSCKIQINDDGVEGTFWDNGTIGNFWGDYNGTDSNGNGIGDAPFMVNGYKWDNDVDGFVSFVSGQDNYPLMKPYEIEYDTIQLPTPSPSPSPSFSEQPTPTPPVQDGIHFTPWLYIIVGVAIVAVAVSAFGLWKLRGNRQLRSKINVS
jgi:parallel beta-helix repeat protein